MMLGFILYTAAWQTTHYKISYNILHLKTEKMFTEIAITLTMDEYELQINTTLKATK